MTKLRIAIDMDIEVDEMHEDFPSRLEEEIDWFLNDDIWLDACMGEAWDHLDETLGIEPYSDWRTVGRCRVYVEED